MLKKGFILSLCALLINACASQSQTWLWKAQYAAWEGNAVDAVTYSNKALHIQPNLAEAYLQRGHAFLRLGSPERSKEDFIQALELKPELFNEHLASIGIHYPHNIQGLNVSTKASVIYYTSQASWHEKARKSAEALESYTELISYRSIFTPILTLRRGELFKKVGNCPKAVQDFKQACKQGLGEACARSCS